MYARIIPRLDIKGENLVKGIHLEGLRVLGKPEEFAKLYYEEGADELLYMDVVASLYERNSLHDIISKTAKEIFIPLTVGGGIRSIEDMQTVFRSGADKIAINTAAVRNPKLISEAANLFGSANFVVAIEAIKQDDGNYYAFTDNGREKTGFEVVSWAKTVEELGAGEIILTSVDKEGTGEGFDINLIKKVSEAVRIPVIAHGGAGKLEDIKSIFKNGDASGVSLASILHYNVLGRSDESTFSNKKVTPASIREIKDYLTKEKIPCRN